MSGWKMTAAMCLALGALFANPNNPTVVSGTVSFETPNANTLKVTASDMAIINWEGFSVGSGELTKFIQPSSSASVLNRVTGFSSSQIHGSLQANGYVYLINPSGVIVGHSGMVNTSGFLASTLDVMDSEFLGGGDLHFVGTSMEKVKVEGTINGWHGDIILLARHVEHTGEMSAEQGSVLIGVGNDILLMEEGVERIFINPAMGLPSGTGIQSTGAIRAMSAELKADGNIYALAINTSGLIDAKGVADEGGRIVLKAEDGVTQVDGVMQAVHGDRSGGDIHVLGKYVRVESGAVIDARGLMDGGMILIGGNTPGDEPIVYNSISTIVADTAYFDASSKASGNGGTVAIWSDADTEYWGYAAAEGGAIGGNGGRVLVGGVSTLRTMGQGDTMAPYGDLGMMAMGTSNIDVKVVPSPIPPVNTVAVSLLLDNMSRNQMILATLPDWPGTMDIVFHDPVHWVTPGGLYLIAGNDIVLHSSMSYLGGDNASFFYAKPNRDFNVEPTTGPVSLNFPTVQFAVFPDRDLNVAAGSFDGGSVAIHANDLLCQSGRNMNLLGGGNNSSVTISGAASCELQTGIVEAGGYLYTEGGTGVDSDVHLPAVEITSFGPNS